MGKIKTFTLETKEIEALEKFMESQMEKHPAYTKTIGGRFTVMFTITSLGCGVEVLDQVTGEIENITDYDMW